MTENPATLIESGFASRASTHNKKNKSQTSQKFDSRSLHSLGQLPKRADEANRLVRSLQPIGSQKATSVHRLQHRVDLKVRRKQHQFTERNTGLQNTTGSSRPHLRTSVRSIRQSAVSGRASSSFTSVGGNTRITPGRTPSMRWVSACSAARHAGPSRTSFFNVDAKASGCDSSLRPWRPNSLLLPI